MTSTISLPTQHRRTCRMVFSAPSAPAVTWAALRALLEEIGEVVEHPYGILKITRHGESLVLRTPVNGLESTPELLAGVRQFFERTHVALPATARNGDWLVVIDRLEASLYRSVAPGAVPQLVRFAPHGNAAGAKRAALPGFFEPLAGLLHGARRILIFRRAANLGDEASPFVLWMRKYHPEIANRIVASASVDLEECSGAVLLAKARGFYSHLPEAPLRVARAAGPSDEP